MKFHKDPLFWCCVWGLVLAIPVLLIPTACVVFVLLFSKLAGDEW